MAGLTFSCGAGSYTGGDEPEPEPECAEVVLDAGGGIDKAPDGALLCPEGSCNYQAGDGCVASESCQPVFDSEAGTVTPTCLESGQGRAGDSCSSGQTATGCASGFFCADGACRQLCCGGDWSVCEGETSCFRPLFFRLESGNDLVSADVGLCFPTGTCHVLKPGSCEEEDPGKTCKIVDPTGAQACVPSGPGEAGEICETPDYCGPGLSCVGHICRRLCRAEACGEPACPADEGVCVHFDRDPEGVGECTPNFLVE